MNKTALILLFSMNTALATSPSSLPNSPNNINALLSSKDGSGRVFNKGPIEFFGDAWQSFNQQRINDWGLDLGLAYTTLSQTSSEGQGRRTGAVGDLDVYGRWQLRKTKQSPGYLGFALETRDRIAALIPPAALSNTLGTSWGVVGWVW